MSAELSKNLISMNIEVVIIKKTNGGKLIYIIDQQQRISENIISFIVY